MRAIRGFRNVQNALRASVAYGEVQGGNVAFPTRKHIRICTHVRDELGIQALEDAVHFIDVVAGGSEHEGEYLLLLAFGQVLGLGRQLQNDRRAHRQDQRDEEQTPHQAAHQPLHEPHDELSDLLTPPVHDIGPGGRGVDRLQKTAASGRHDGNCDEHGHQNGGGDRHRYVGVELPGFLLDEDDGDEHEHRGQRRGEHGGPDFTHAVERRLDTPFTQQHVPVDVLQHDDAVVQGHADGEGDPGQ